MINTRTHAGGMKVLLLKKTFPSSLPVVVVSAGMEILEGKDSIPTCWYQDWYD